MVWMAALPISTQESMDKVQPHGYAAPPFRLFTQSGAGADAASGPKIVAILTAGISPSAFPI
jgi:hypothetical protein